ncbi:ion channel [Pseudoteredinibacter isoporae]|uniref:Potassium channel domain-containing protein n=1 Tax=Pseudoteredinibacter isoporae TaxID=570281 RepID=A0A7X0JU97_9GAMM|nr:hypothetical protein [Pseudoteredinibacter isoporae]
MFEDDRKWQQGEMLSCNDVAEQLQQRARTGQAMRDFKLKACELENVNLVNHNSKHGYRLIDSDLYRANMRGAHCFMLDLSGSSLMKADFTGANLHCANLSNCNLLGTKFHDAKLEHVRWGDKVIQECKADESGSREEQLDLYEQAEEIYRHLRKVFENQGLFENAGYFFEREMVVRRKQMPQYSSRRFISKIVDLFCGYGEQPIRVVAFSSLAILGFATLYFFSGISFAGEHIAFSTSANWQSNLVAYLESVYFSIVTFTTLGYGDITPTGLSRLFASIEALMGSFTLALFVVVFVKKMTR